MQKHTENFLIRLLEECMATSNDHVTVNLTEQEKQVAWEVLNELIAEGYISGFCPQMDSFFRCDLTAKALDRCDFKNQTIL